MQDCPQHFLSRLEEQDISAILANSLEKNDWRCLRSFRQLTALEIQAHEARAMLASYRSTNKYRYDIRKETLYHILGLVREDGQDSPLAQISHLPICFAKACWLYEHCPFFLYLEEKNVCRDSLLRDYARQYCREILTACPEKERWKEPKSTKQVFRTTFWEQDLMDPVKMVENCLKQNLAGMELSLDFHPFNFSRLLPEEIPPAKRMEIRHSIEKSGIAVDIHSPIVGPYLPSPDPSKGKQSFYTPGKCREIIFDAIRFAGEIGAGSVVVHLIDAANTRAIEDMIDLAADQNVKISLENYCRTSEQLQSGEIFLQYAQRIKERIPRNSANHFGITLDVGHFNIEGEDPLLAAEKVGLWCRRENVELRMHATDNYGNLLFHPPAYSADVHSNVSGKGINNALIIQMLRSMGHEFRVIAEQIQPLSPEDIETIDSAQAQEMKLSYETLVKRGRRKLEQQDFNTIITPDAANVRPYQFLAGLKDTSALQEYLIYRRIQNREHLSVNEAKEISERFMNMPREVRETLTKYIDDLLLPVQAETGTIQKKELDLICQNICSALFASINNEHLKQIFSKDREYRKGETICRQNTPGREMYYMKQGKAHVTIDGTTMTTLGFGQIFGEISLFYNVRRTATVTALENGTVVGILTRKGLGRLFITEKSYAHDLVFRLYRILPERLRNLDDKYRNIIHTLHLILEGDTPPPTHQLDPPLETALPGTPAESELLPSLTEEEASEICSSFRPIKCGETICSEGEIGDRAYYIAEGEAKVISSSPDHREILFGKLEAGEIFGEMTLIDSKPRSASVVTLTDCIIGTITEEDYNSILGEKDSELAFRLMGFISLSLFRRILQLDQMFSTMKRKLQENYVVKTISRSNHQTE